jgi:hypothetical protein
MIRSIRHALRTAAIAVLVVGGLLAVLAHAGDRRVRTAQRATPCPGGSCPTAVASYRGVYVTNPVYSVPMAPQAPQRAAQVPSRAYYAAAPVQVAAPTVSGPLDGVNAIRARRGLSALGWDAGLASWASSNSARGFGHAVMAPGASQCVAFARDPITASGQWESSGQHLALILAARSSAGLAIVNGVATLNLR